MSPVSNGSSMDPQNGSASNGGHQGHSRSQTTYAGSSNTTSSRITNARNLPTRYQAGHTTADSAIRYENSYDNRYQIHPGAPAGYENRTSSHASNHVNGTYAGTQPNDLPSAPIYTQEMTAYDNEITLEGDQNRSSQTQGNYPTNEYANQQPVSQQYDTQPSSQHQIPQDSQQQRSNASHEGPSLTIDRWSSEYASDEAIRLGLPRHESNQQHVEYEQTSYTYEETTSRER